MGEEASGLLSLRRRRWGRRGEEEGGDKTKRHGGSETLHKHLAA